MTLAYTPVAAVSQGCPGHATLSGRPCERVPMNLLFDDIEVIESVGDPSAVEVGGISHDSRRVVPGRPLLLRARPRQRRARLRRRGGGPRRGRPPVRALHPRARRPATSCRPGSRRGTMRPVMARLAAAFYGYPARDLLDDRRDRHERQDDRDAAPRRPPQRGRASRPTSWGRCRARGRRRRRPRCSGSWPGCATARSPTVSATPWPWRCRATRSSSRGSRASTSTWPSSPTSATTTSTTTARWRSTSRRRRCSSRRATRCAASSTPTIRGAGGSSERARIPMVAVHHADATDIVLRPGRTEFTWRGQRITTPLTGAVNVDNALLAAEAALALEEPDLGPEEIARAMANLAPVPGRLQVIAAPGARAARPGAASRRRERPPSPCSSTTRTRRPGSRWCSARRGRSRRAGGCSASSAAAGTGTGPSAR